MQGTYQIVEPRFELEFTDLKIKLGGIGNSSVLDFANSVKQNRIGGVFSLPGNQKYPNGPVGAKGEVDSVFIDETLRIDRGQNFADGIQDLFILERAN